jgi:DNA-directed RNA polymerase subunit alpha
MELRMALGSNVNWTTLIRPRKDASDRHTEFVCEPLDRGFGDQLGAALRRALLEHVPGAAVVAARARLDGVEPLASWMTELCLNLSQLVLSAAETTQYVRLDVPAGRVVRADALASAGVSTLDGAHVLCIAHGRLRLELWFERSFGMCLTPKWSYTSLPADAWPVEAFFCPVLRANYHVERPQIRPWNDLDRLLLDIETNGAVTPQEALWTAVHALSRHDLAACIEPGPRATS